MHPCLSFHGGYTILIYHRLHGYRIKSPPPHLPGYHTHLTHPLQNSNTNQNFLLQSHFRNIESVPQLSCPFFWDYDKIVSLFLRLCSWVGMGWIGTRRVESQNHSWLFPHGKYNSVSVLSTHQSSTECLFPPQLGRMWGGYSLNPPHKYPYLHLGKVCELMHALLECFSTAKWLSISGWTMGAWMGNT